jgi:hypothetical protein
VDAELYEYAEKRICSMDRDAAVQKLGNSIPVSEFKVTYEWVMRFMS